MTRTATNVLETQKIEKMKIAITNFTIPNPHIPLKAQVFIVYIGMLQKTLFHFKTPLVYRIVFLLLHYCPKNLKKPIRNRVKGQRTSLETLPNLMAISSLVGLRLIRKLLHLFQP